jgi:hypothetical protein
MADINEKLNTLKTKQEAVAEQKVARFSYTDTAYANDNASGVIEYNFNNEQNVPTKDRTFVRSVVLDKGIRTQAASLPRDMFNHFFGRVSYNLNKLHDWFKEFLANFLEHLSRDGSLYSPFAKYKKDDICYMNISGVVNYFQRTSSSPVDLTGVAPSVNGVITEAHWKTMATAISVPSLEQGLNSEAATRAAADTALQNYVVGVDNGLASEAAVRSAVDISLQSSITAEANARAEADVTINNRLSGELIGLVGTVVLALYEESGSPSKNYFQTVTLSGSSPRKALILTDITGHTGDDLTSGQWRCMGAAPNLDVNRTRATLWVRIA